MAHRYWRVKATSLDSGAPYMACAELSLATLEEGPNIATGGTPVADSYYAPEGLTSAKAFDGNTGTYWACNGTGTAAYIGYDFGAGNDKDILEVRYTVRNDAYHHQAPTAATIDYSDDGSVWTVAKTISGMAAWSQGETRVWQIARTGGTVVEVAKAIGYAVLGAADKVEVQKAIGYAVIGGDTSRVEVAKIVGYAVVNPVLVRRPVVFCAA